MEPFPYIAEPATPHVSDGTFVVVELFHRDCGDCLDCVHSACVHAAATGSVGATMSSSASGGFPRHQARVERAPRNGRTRSMFLFDVSKEDFAQIGQAYVELFIEDGEIVETAIAFRTDQYDMWGPPVPGRQAP